MRLKVILNHPLPERKCWIEVPEFSTNIQEEPITTSSSICDLAKYLTSHLNLEVDVMLELDGFELLPKDRVKGVLRENDLVL
jgi:hypothetical protein